MNSSFKILFLIGLIFLFLLAGPWLLFWSIETIAAAAGFTIFIPLTFWTWLAAVVFFALARGGTSK